MVKNPVIWTKTANRQKREVVRYWTIRNGSTQYAESLIKQVVERIEMILRNPFSGKPTRVSLVREVVLGKYSIFYKIVGEQIIIIALWDNRQNPKKLLEILKM